MHPLDNVIWQALTTRQSRFAEAFDCARRFFREVTALCAFEQPGEKGYVALAGLTGEVGTAAIFLDRPYEAREGWEHTAGAPLLQMVCENGATSSVPSSSEVEILELGDSDSPEMVE